MVDMISSFHMLVVVGARPQFIKAAAIHRAMSKLPNWTSTWVHAGQHHDHALSEQFFRELELPSPHVRLTPRQENRELRMGDMMSGIRQSIRDSKPDWVLVFGDTDATLAGAWAASAEQVPLVHVEAGLRSGDWSMPEEINRVLTDRLSSVLVCPTDAAMNHLKSEGIKDTLGESRGLSPSQPVVLRTGDVMHDNAVHFGENWPIESRGRGEVLITLHRPANVDDIVRLRNWLSAIGAWLRLHEFRAVFPIHPRTQHTMEDSWSDWEQELKELGIRATPPLAYLELLRCICEAPLVLTDSGGVQKECYSLGTRCAVLRPTTEWVEQVHRGQSQLVQEPSELAEIASELIRRGRFLPDELYGNGQSAMEMLRCLESIDMRNG